MSGLEIRDLRVAYGRTQVLDGVSLQVAPGETLVLFGASGAGKTVLLRAIAGVEPGATGQVFVDGRDVGALGPERRGVGVAFQNFALYPHLAARDNVASPLRARGLSAAEVDDRVGRIAALLKIGHVLGHLPRQLSNGQKQRTALARALVGEPRVLLLDDPLRNVDAKLRYEMRLELPRLLRRAAATVYVSQDHREAMALGDRIAALVDGRIVQDAAPEAIYDAPATLAVARLFGDPPVNLAPCRPVLALGGLRADVFGLSLILERDRAAAGRECMLGLRPEALRVHAEARPGAAPATLVAVTPLHERSVLLLRRPGGEDILASAVGSVPAPGAAVWVSADPGRALLYEAESGRAVAVAAPAEVAA